LKIRLRNGYAFVECGDQATADRVIDRFNGASFAGKYLRVEPATILPSADSGNATLIISPADG